MSIIFTSIIQKSKFIYLLSYLQLRFQLGITFYYLEASKNICFGIINWTNKIQLRVWNWRYFIILVIGYGWSKNSGPKPITNSMEYWIFDGGAMLIMRNAAGWCCIVDSIAIEPPKWTMPSPSFVWYRGKVLLRDGIRVMRKWGFISHGYEDKNLKIMHNSLNIKL